MVVYEIDEGRTLRKAGKRVSRGKGDAEIPSGVYGAPLEGHSLPKYFGPCGTFGHW